MDMLNISDGIRTILKYLEDPSLGQAESDHWILWVDGPPPSEMSEEDASLLAEHGWVYKDDFVQTSLLSGPAKRWAYHL